VNALVSESTAAIAAADFNFFIGSMIETEYLVEWWLKLNYNIEEIVLDVDKFNSV
jgi:hypothetical protein